MKKICGSRRGQVSLEVGFALAAAFILLIGATVIFAWLNGRLVYREERYEGHPDQGRMAAGLTDDTVIPNEEELPWLDIWQF